MSFLKAEWRKLVMVNYEIDPEILKPYVPKGTELDFFEGKCYISLVGFMFLNTKLLGVKIPFHVNFEEVNLRFYVRKAFDEGVKRGVVFIKEIVPKPAITFIANTIYNENYETLPMKHSWETSNDSVNVTYQWKKNNSWNSMAIQAQNRLNEIQPNSVVEFIAEHYWGYSKKNAKETTEYEVKHPRWKYYPVKQHSVEVDFKSNYGDEFEFLNQANPNSIFLLEGSEISVEDKIVLK